jgi:N-acetylneuraminic acid mutarotase
VAVDGLIYVIGGAEASNRKTAAVQIFDPERLQWHRGPDAPSAWDFHTAAVVAGRIHVISGHQEGVGSQRGQWVFDPGTGYWSQRAPIPVAVNAAMTQAIGDRIYVLGGVVAQDYRSTVQVYDPGTDMWSFGGELPVGTLSSVSAVMDGRIHLVGGGVPVYATSDQHLVYDPATRLFDRELEYPYPMEAGGGGAVGGAFCVFGGRVAARGRRNVPFSGGSCYADGRWEPLPPMPTPRAEVAYVTLDGMIYAIGGDGHAPAMSTVERLVFRSPVF